MLIKDEPEPQPQRESALFSDTYAPYKTEPGRPEAESVLTREWPVKAAESNIEGAVSEVTDVRKVDIVAKKDFERKPASASQLIKIGIWIVAGITILRFAQFGFWFRLIVGCVFVSKIVKAIKKIVKTDNPLIREYNAVVLDHSVSTNTAETAYGKEIVTVGKVKVLADIDGTETCILIEAGDGHVTSMYPVGCTVKIRGYGDYWVVLG